MAEQSPNAIADRAHRTSSSGEGRLGSRVATGPDNRTAWAASGDQPSANGVERAIDGDLPPDALIEKENWRIAAQG